MRRRRAGVQVLEPARPDGRRRAEFGMTAGRQVWRANLSQGESEGKRDL